MKRAIFLTCASAPAAFLAVSLGATHCAWAQDRPLTMPTRAVAVTYHVSQNGTGNAESADIRMYFKGGANLVRIDPPGQQGYAIIDRGNHHVTVVVPQQRSYFEISSNTPGDVGFLLDDRMNFTRKGTDAVLGIPCTDWTVQTDDSNGTACVTSDGVLLRASGTDQSGKVQGMAVATAVTYAQQSENLFKVPSGYRKVQPPAPPSGAQGQANPGQKEAPR